MAEVSKGLENPLPTTLPNYENSNGGLTVDVDSMLQLLDVMERIQQQLGQINNNNNLEPGERFN